MSSAAEDGGAARPTALTVAQLAALLSAVGPSVAPAEVEADRAAGAPTNPDGTINLIHYAAWLVREQGK